MVCERGPRGVKAPSSTPVRFLGCCLTAALLAAACTYQIEVDEHPIGFQPRVDLLKKKVWELGPIAEDPETGEAAEDPETGEAAEGTEEDADG